jgi:hypothetical protein
MTGGLKGQRERGGRGRDVLPESRAPCNSLWVAFTEREPEMAVRGLNLPMPLNSSPKKVSDSCCTGPGLDGAPGCGHVDHDGPEYGEYGFLDGPGSDGVCAHVGGPGSGGGGAHVDGPGSGGGRAHVDGPGSDGRYGLFDGLGSDGGWSSAGPGLRGRFKSMSKSSCRGGGLKSCDSDGLGDLDFIIAHISYDVQGDITTSDGDLEPAGS